MILEIEHLSVSVNKQPLFTDLEFNLRPAESVWLHGPSGSGKTVLTQLLAGIAAPEIKVEKGKVFFKQKLILSEKKWTHAERKILYISEFSCKSFSPALKIKSQLLENRSEREKVAEWLELLNLSSCLLEKFPAMLSGGEVQRLLLLLALLQDPEILILDEPCNHLDFFSEQQIVELISKIRKQKGFALILVAHNRRVARRLTEKAYCLKNRCLKEDSYDKLKLPTGNLKKNFLNKNGEDYLQLEAVDKFYFNKSKFKRQSRQEVFCNLNFVLQKGTSALLLGASGSGKSTLGKILFNLTPIQKGRVVFFNCNWQQPADFYRKNQILFQHSVLSFNPLIKLKADFEQLKRNFRLDLSLRETEQRLFQLNLPADTLERFPRQLSAGQLQRAALLRLLILRPEFLFLDEPFNYLDQENIDLLWDLLFRLQQENNLTLLIVAHNPFDYWHFFDQHFSLSGKNIIRFHDYQEVIADGDLN